MKVFRCEPQEPNVEGIVIVAANSPKEAKEAVEQYVLWENLYPEQDFEEISNLEYKGEKTKVLVEYHIYIEET